MWKKLLSILAVLAFFIVILGCSKKDNAVVTATNHTWYLYQDQGEDNVVSVKFTDKRAIVNDMSSIGDKVGIQRLNVHNKRPTFTLDNNGKTITVNSANKLAFTLGKKYKENVYGRHMQGYYVTYKGDTYKFAYITKTDKKSKAVQENKSRSQKISYEQMKNHIVNIDYGAEAPKNTNFIGKYNFKTIINYRRTDGNLTVNNDGTYQMTLTEHAAQALNDKVDNPTIMTTLVTSSQIKSLYGKYYLVPKNLLTIEYYFHGQNQDHLLPKSVNLKVDSKSTGNQIDLARTRIEEDSNQLYLFSSDYTVRQQEGQSNSKGNLLTKSNSNQTELKDAITQTNNYYLSYLANPVQSNADFMQLVAAISDNNKQKVGDVEVDFGGKYSTNQNVSDYKGVDVDGNSQPDMQYVFLVTAAQNGDNSPTVATSKGKFLVYGMLNNKLYLLRQPDKDSTTVTWTLVKDVSLKVPALKFTVN
ncbi:hypothetical protein FC72_GL002034 [Companilactobacillus tucceti DSM 20183]|uniref:Lipoprotein n=1 Tax=Companilactobacillus tucceti DSM 20183 TaxID=1423811 RepID=A0A0R1JAC7_9LACO|nr:hypothetical protein [Companilactobacillus tucceti]KRK64626.1 hypothetical protein FC72_GL002034 [Companilactobacillus tucceti DSM 20183]